MTNKTLNNEANYRQIRKYKPIKNSETYNIVWKSFSWKLEANSGNGQKSKEEEEATRPN